MIYNNIEYNSGDEIGNNGLKFIEEIEPRFYNGYKERWAVFQCPKCNKTFNASIHAVKRGKQKSCGCDKKHRKGSEYKPGEYIGDNGVTFVKDISKERGKGRRAIFKCPECGRNFNALISNVKCGYVKHCGCSKYSIKIGDKFGRLTVIERKENCLSNNRSCIWECQCSCGNIVYVQTDYLTRGYKKSCGCLLQESFEDRKVDLSNKRSGLLTFIEATDYRMNGQVVWRCICDCGQECFVPQGNFGRTKSCGCTVFNSNGELIVKEILQKNNINFIQQKQFDNCINPKTGRKLKFDFYLPDYNCCIEYDGIQHFQSVEYFGGKEGLQNNLYRDSIKNEFCRNNNIKLIRIPYTEENIEKFLINELT